MLSSIAHLYHQGGPVLIIIAAMSVLALGVGLERLTAARRYRRRMATSSQRIMQHLHEGNRTMAQAVNASLPWHPAVALFQLALEERATSPSQLRRVQSRVIRAMKLRLWVLGTIGAIAPFVGLFGTVLGIIDAFRQIGIQGTGGFQVVSGGISEALITTAGGILVGVEAMVLFNYLQVETTEYAAELREATEEILESAAEVSRVPAGASAN